MTNSSLAAGEQIELSLGLDLDKCLALAADSRPWPTRVTWHDRALCRDSPADTYVGEVPPSPGDIARCLACPVRAECAVEGLRQNVDDLVADSADEMWGFFGGLGPEERWHLVGSLRRLAADRGVALCDATSRRGELIDQYYGLGWSTTQIADELGVVDETVVEHIALRLADQGWSNRRIAAALPRHSYKWFERRVRHLRAAASCETRGATEAA
jgi:hypothetical protein